MFQKLGKQSGVMRQYGQHGASARRERGRPARPDLAEAASYPDRVRTREGDTRPRGIRLPVSTLASITLETHSSLGAMCALP